MAGLADAVPGLHRVRRVITRAPDLGGEDYDAVSVAVFADMVAAGAFASHWTAHGLSYGIPAAVRTQVANGTDCLANFSRKALTQAATVFPRLVVLNITVAPETIAKRLAERGRESEVEIAKRLSQADRPLPEGLDVVHIANDGALSDTVSRAAALFQPDSVSR